MIVLMSSCANLPWECNMWTTVRCDYTPPPVLRIFFSSIQGPCFLSGRFKTLTRKAASPKARALGRQAPWERCTGIPKKAFGQRPSPSAGITAAETRKLEKKQCLVLVGWHAGSVVKKPCKSLVTLEYPKEYESIWVGYSASWRSSHWSSDLLVQEVCSFWSLCFKSSTLQPQPGIWRDADHLGGDYDDGWIPSHLRASSWAFQGGDWNRWSSADCADSSRNCMDDIYILYIYT